jgi:hypothetical protein
VCLSQFHKSRHACVFHNFTSLDIRVVFHNFTTKQNSSILREFAALRMTRCLAKCAFDFVWFRHSLVVHTQYSALALAQQLHNLLHAAASPSHSHQPSCLSIYIQDMQALQQEHALNLALKANLQLWCNLWHWTTSLSYPPVKPPLYCAVKLACCC